MLRTTETVRQQEVGLAIRMITRPICLLEIYRVSMPRTSTSIVQLIHYSVQIE